MLSSSKTFVSTVVFIVVLQLYGTCIHTAYALEDIADGLSQNISALQEGGIGMLGGFLTSCKSIQIIRLVAIVVDHNETTRTGPTDRTEHFTQLFLFLFSFISKARSRPHG